ncbi:hypothetical protein PAHAL_1G351400 [Panicum hallii]|uniref:Uncharacterized protein n=1 Tax=Panicum hallii TaxID=206008 RepID=A0A2T8KXA4_9POAL|nr:hypothetical protein PAHAL_1G351400 [Panicum hallii]
MRTRSGSLYSSSNAQGRRRRRRRAQGRWRWAPGRAGRDALLDAEEKFAAGEVVAALRAVEREMEAAARAVPAGVVTGVVAAVREPATARLAAKVLLVVLLDEGNRDLRSPPVAVPAPAARRGSPHPPSVAASSAHRLMRRPLSSVRHPLLRPRPRDCSPSSSRSRLRWRPARRRRPWRRWQRPGRRGPRWRARWPRWSSGRAAVQGEGSACGRQAQGRSRRRERRPSRR